MIVVKKFVFNPFFENTYVVWDTESKEAAVIDPGCSDDIEKILLKNFIEKEKLNVKYLINTHCHIDHVLGNSFVMNEFKTRFLASEEELFFLDTLHEYGKTFGIETSPSPKPDEFITDSKKILIGKSEGKFISTPGHSPGGHALYFEKEKICFSGDTLFYESVGRTDLWKGDFNLLMKSIKEKLYKLPDSTIVYPGHETETTIGHEKLNNTFIK